MNQSSREASVFKLLFNAIRQVIADVYAQYCFDRGFGAKPGRFQKPQMLMQSHCFRFNLGPLNVSLSALNRGWQFVIYRMMATDGALAFHLRAGRFEAASRIGFPKPALAKSYRENLSAEIAKNNRIFSAMGYDK